MNPLKLLIALLLPVLAAPAQGPAHLTQLVRQAEPPVQWPVPASIGYGTALDSAQLNASSTLPGTMAYMPAAGSVLDPGQQTLTVVFTPADVNYHPVTLQVPLTVRPLTGVTFNLGLLHPPPGEVTWKPGNTLNLWLTPVGDFHQPVALSCLATAGYKCSLDQNLMRPVSVALPLRVTITRDPQGQREPIRGPIGAFSAMLLLAVISRRKRLRGAGVLLVLLVGIAGCGSARTATVTVTGTSLTETKSLVIHVVDTR